MCIERSQTMWRHSWPHRTNSRVLPNPTLALTGHQSYFHLLRHGNPPWVCPWSGYCGRTCAHSQILCGSDTSWTLMFLFVGMWGSKLIYQSESIHRWDSKLLQMELRKLWKASALTRGEISSTIPVSGQMLSVHPPHTHTRTHMFPSLFASLWTPRPAHTKNLKKI